MDWIEAIGQVLPAYRLDEETRIVSISPAACRAHRINPEQAIGKTLSEIARREGEQSVLPPAWRYRNGYFGADGDTNPVGGLLEAAARDQGNATAWIWMLTPGGQVLRALCNVVKLEQGFVIYVANVEDPFSRSLVRYTPDGKLLGHLGGEWDFQSLQVFEDFCAGVSLKEIAHNQAIPVSRVRRILERVAESAGMETPGELRDTFIRLYSDMLIPSLRSVFPILVDVEAMPGFPQHDRPT